MLEFNLQRFADTVTEDNVISIKTTYADDDTRTFSLPNARDDVTSEEIAELDKWIVDNQILLSDKSLANTTGIESATHINTSRIKLDIGAGE